MTPGRPEISTKSGSPPPSPIGRQSRRSASSASSGWRRARTSSLATPRPVRITAEGSPSGPAHGRRVMAGKSRLFFGRSGSILNLPISLSGCSGIPMLNHRLRAASAPNRPLACSGQASRPGTGVVSETAKSGPPSGCPEYKPAVCYGTAGGVDRGQVRERSGIREYGNIGQRRPATYEV